MQTSNPTNHLHFQLNLEQPYKMQGAPVEAVLLSTYLFLLATCCECRKNPSKVKCFVADSIFDHVPMKTWWWQSGLRNIHAQPKGFSKSWRVYVKYQNEISNMALLEFVLPTDEGRCRFLIKKPRSYSGGSFVGLTRPLKCQSGAGGKRTLFRASLKGGPVNRHRHRMVRRDTNNRNRQLFAGYHRQKRMLTLSKYRNDEDVAWWQIDLSKISPCPGR